MKKKIYLHIGPHRTATTSSQIMFSEMAVPDNTAFFYPSTGRSSQDSHYGHNLIFQANSYSHDPLFTQLLTEIEACRHEKLLLSAENFYAVDPLLLKESFSDYDVKIIYTKRNFFDWIVSIAAFNLMYGARFNLLEFFRNAVIANFYKENRSVPYTELDFFNWNSRIARWYEVFGDENMMCTQFETKYPYLDILSAVCDTSQIGSISHVDLHVNQGPSLLGLLASFEADGTHYKIKNIPEQIWFSMAKEFSETIGESFPVNSLFCYKLLSIEFEMSADEMISKNRTCNAPIIETNHHSIDVV